MIQRRFTGKHQSNFFINKKNQARQHIIQGNKKRNKKYWNDCEDSTFLINTILLCKQLLKYKHLIIIFMNSRLKWTQQEEDLLKTLGATDKKNKWTVIAKLINEKSPAFRRTPKQCREKYNNHLVFGQIASDNAWTTQEDQILFRQYKQRGPKWKLISQCFPTRSQNTIKNKFYGNVRKMVRKLNKIGKEKINKSLKPIRQKSIIRIIESEIGIEDAPEEMMRIMRSLRLKLLEMIQKGIDEVDEESENDKKQIAKIIKQIHNFNCNCRFYSNRKLKKNQKSRQKVTDNDKLKNSTSQEDQISEEQVSQDEQIEGASQSEKSFQQIKYNKKQSRTDQKEIQIKSSPQGNFQEISKIEKSQDLSKQTKQASISPLPNFLLLFHQYVNQYCSVYKIPINSE